MRFGRFDFLPALWPSVATLVLLPMLTGLGVWQLERAAWKQQLVDTHADNASQPPFRLESLLADGEIEQYRRVAVLGRYDLDHQLLLDNRIQNGRAGYHVLTPLHLAESDTVVLVNRGWVPVGPDRSVLPALPGTADEVVVNATVKLPPEKYFRLDSVEEANTGWPQVVQQLKPGMLAERLGLELLPLVLLLDVNDEYGFVREWKAVYGVTPDKHRAYAMQWFTLALVLLLIYVGVNTKRHVPDMGRE